MKKFFSLFRFAIVLPVFLCLVTTTSYAFDVNRSFYEIRIYHLATQLQGQKVEKYLKEAFIPAMHRAGINKIGVFKPFIDSIATQLIYVFIPYISMEQFGNVSGILEKDAQYNMMGKEYIDALYSDPPYTRMESILLKAFEGMPSFYTPKLNSPVAERVYELRSYEGHTEKIYRNKVQMFNQGNEIGLFSRLGFNAVFYGEVLVGSRMPNLMYMTSFENIASRDVHWKAFVDDAEWKKLEAMKEYKNNVSKNIITLLRPTEYSEI